MDTTTVNFAIDKLNQAFQHIKPTAVELGSEFIGYTVLKAALWPVILLIVTVGVCYVGVKLIKLGQAQAADHTKHGDGFAGYLLGTASLAVGAILSLITLSGVYTAILAIAYPLMYTIEQLTK